MDCPKYVFGLPVVASLRSSGENGVLSMSSWNHSLFQSMSMQRCTEPTMERILFSISFWWSPSSMSKRSWMLWRYVSLPLRMADSCLWL